MNEEQEIHKLLFEEYKSYFKKVIYNKNENRKDKFKDFVTIKAIIKKTYRSLQDEIKETKKFRSLKSKNDEFRNKLLREI